MEIIALTPEKYHDWDEFCHTSDDAWFWHTSDWLEYNLNYKVGSQPESKSFFVLNNNKIAGICPLILETYADGAREFSFGGIYGPAPALGNSLNPKEEETARKTMFSHIDLLAKENDVSRVKFRFSILNKSFIEAKNVPYNHLMKYGFLDNSINTQIIDVSQGEELLRSGLRHGHKYDINRAEKIFKISIFDLNNITKEIFDEYQNLHHQAAGKVTRNEFTFDLMYNLILQDNAFLVAAEKEGKWVGFSYFFRYKDNVYYGSSCNDPDCGQLPIAHAIQWQAIKWMHSKGCQFYEIGWQKYVPTPSSDFESDKEIRISKFKRGFGGFTVPLFRGEKYYNKEYFLKIQQNRVKRYAEFLENIST